MAAGRADRGLDGAALTPSVVLQPTSDDVERLADRDVRVLALGIGLVLLRRLRRAEALGLRMKAGFVGDDDFPAWDG
jgi:hypothetical protein